MGILLNGEYRENILTSGIYNYLEKYVRTNGSAIEGLFCYNFCLQTSPFEIQPSGAINMSKFKNIELEITTFTPPLNNATNDYQIIASYSSTQDLVNSIFSQYDNYGILLP
jgi:hypothetical protein